VPITIPSELIARLDNWLTQVSRDNLFSGSVLIAQRGNVLLSKGYGQADREKNTPNTSQTRFRLASITKQFTAMAVMILEAQGKLRVEDPICKYIADCPPAWKDVTIHHLMTHTSGMPDFTLPDSTGTTFMQEQTIATFRDLPLYFSPGEEWSYSNSGYILLGYIIQQVSGMSYEEFLKESIFVPLGLEDTGYAHNSDGLAIGYDNQYTSLPADLDQAEIFNAAGALYSSTEDLYRWDQALYTEELIPRASLERMFTPYVKVPTVEGDKAMYGYYGYGWLIKQEEGQMQVWHGGGLPGVSTMIARYPEDRITIIILCNNANSDATNIWQLIAGKIFTAD
jgi:CubicO group peptidase (beta-lactamase class C family)